MIWEFCYDCGKVVDEQEDKCYWCGAPKKEKDSSTPIFSEKQLKLDFEFQNDK